MTAETTTITTQQSVPTTIEELPSTDLPLVEQMEKAVLIIKRLQLSAGSFKLKEENLKEVGGCHWWEVVVMDGKWLSEWYMDGGCYG